MRFDAYAGNVSGAPPEEVAAMVAHANQARVERGRPRGRYHDCFEVRDGHEGLGWVGRDGVLETSFFEFKGQTTPQCAGAIRKHWSGAHTVSRMDACEDYDEPGCFPRLVAIIDQAGRGGRGQQVQSHEIRPRTGDRGTTTYWGSKTSRVMVRCYEAGKMRERLHFNRPGWVRVEAQVRPGKAAEKRLAAECTPLGVWGWAAWSHKAAEHLCRVDVPRFQAVSEVPQFDRTTLYLARAFRAHFEQLLAERGDWVCVGRELEEVWRQDDEARQAAASRNA